jgi:hypothetical protein
LYNKPARLRHFRGRQPSDPTRRRRRSRRRRRRRRRWRRRWRRRRWRRRRRQGEKEEDIIYDCVTCTSIVVYFNE